MNKKLMNLAMMYMATSVYASEHVFASQSPNLNALKGISPNLNALKGISPSDKQKCQPKAQHEFTIKGVKIMAASKKDAIKKYNHRKK